MIGFAQRTLPETVAIGGMSSAWKVIPVAASSVTPSSCFTKSRCQKSRRYSPSVIPCRPMACCFATAPRMHSSSTAFSHSAGSFPALAFARAATSSGGRSRLPTWSARKGGFMSSRGAERRGISIGTASYLALECSARDQALEIVRAADQQALHEHHGESRPAGPELERQAAAILAQVAAVPEILVREPGRVEQLPRLSRKRIHAHPDHDDLVLLHRRLDLLNDVGAVARELPAYGGMDLHFVENGAGHGLVLAFRA